MRIPFPTTVRFAVLIMVLCWLFGGVCLGQPQTIVNAPVTASLSEHSLAQRGLDFKVWQGFTYWTDGLGEMVTNNQSYTELATGMSYVENGQLVDSVQEIDAVAGGFQATQGRHQVQFADNANTPNGAVTLTMPDNSQMVSTVYGLAYWDQSSGSNVLIAPLQDSVGALAASNELVYPNAFQGITADLQYVYRIGGMSQNVLIKSLPSPAAYGLVPESTVLQVITTFLTAPEPAKTAVNRNNENFDDVLNFGPMFISVGQAVLLQTNGGSQPAGVVGKHWLRTNQTDYLIEELPYSAVTNISPPQASNVRPGFGPVWRTAMAKPNHETKTRQTAAHRLEHKPSKSPRVIDRALAARLAHERYILVDYDIVSGTTNLTFQGDSTYYISAPLTLVGTSTFEGGAVIKYATNAYISMSSGSTNAINWLASDYLPVVFTAKDNDNVGATLTNSTHTPVGYYANPALSFNGITPSNSMSHFVIQYAVQAISTPSTSISFYDGQIVNCSNGIAASSGTVAMGNLLFAKVPTALNNANATGTINWQAYNTTFGGYNNSSSVLLLGAIGVENYLYLTNCILANLSQFWASGSGGTLGATDGADNGFYNNGQSSFGSSPVSVATSPFQIVGAGGFYLTNGCSFISAGTTNMSPSILEDIQLKTVYPPNTNYVTKVITSNSVTFSNQVQRDNGPSPSLGYHYDPIDYACSLSLNYSTLTINPGIVVAGAGSTYAIKLNLGTNYCVGNATNMVYLMRYTTVQEQSNTNWQGAWTAFFQPNSSYGPGLSVQFAVLMALSTEDFFYGFSADVVYPFAFENCQIYNAPFYTYTASPSFTNCLFRRPYFLITDASGRGESNQFYNNLFYYGQMTNYHSVSGSPWIFNDNLFDHTVITNTDYAPTEANNGYVTNSVFSMLTTNKGPYDVILPASPNYEPGPLGTFYYPTNYYPTSGTNLIFAGSRLASVAGLAGYTVTTNDTIDGTNIVSIGFHYPGAYISQQPESQIICNGSPVTFSVIAGGLGLSYQWQFNGANISGATNSSWNTNASSATAGDYDVVVSNQYWQLTSDSAVLTIASPPSITQQPGNAGLGVGGYTNFSIAANGTAPLTYQWQSNGVSLSGATSAVLEIINVGTSDTGSYDVIVANSCGSVTSTVVTLTVTNGGPTLPVSGYYAWWNPDTLSSNPGTWTDSSPNAFTASASSIYSPILTSVNGHNVLSFNPGASAFTNDLRFSGGFSPNMSNCVLFMVIQPAPHMTNHVCHLLSDPSAYGWIFNTANDSDGASQYELRPGSVDPSAGHNGQDEVRTNWQVFAASFNASNGTDICWTNGSVAYSNVFANCNDHLFGPGYFGTWGNSTDYSGYLADIIVYTNQVNVGGLVASNTALLETKYGIGPPYFTQDPGSQTVAFSNSATFSVSAVGSSPLAYQWVCNGSALSGATASSLTISPTLPPNLGSYTVIVTNSFGSVTSSAAVLTMFPFITNQPASPTIHFGDPNTFTVSAVGTAPLSYQWESNGFVIAGATGSSYTLNPAESSAPFSVVVTNLFGAVTSSNAILSYTEPEIPEEDGLLWLYFPTNWESSLGTFPVAYTNITSIPLWRGRGMVLDTTNIIPAYLEYRGVETNGNQNITFDEGAFNFFFSPHWASATSDAHGSGPNSNSWAYLTGVGDWGSNSPQGFMGLAVNGGGTNLYFYGVSNAVTNIYASASIDWQSNQWHFIAASWSPSNSVLYIDSGAVATGTSVAYIPSTNILTNGGLFIGSASNGFDQARGVFAAWESWDYAVPGTNLTSTNYWNYMTNEIITWQNGGGGQGNGITNSEPPPCMTGTNAYIAYFTSTSLGASNSVAFYIEGGSIGTNYDLFVTTNVATGSNVEWTWIGSGTNCGMYQFVSSAPESFYVPGSGLPALDASGLSVTYEYLINSNTNGDTFGTPTAWYLDHGINPLTTPNVGTQDPDWDGLLNWQEYEYGSNPTMPQGFAIWVSEPSGTSGIP